MPRHFSWLENLIRQLAQQRSKPMHATAMLAVSKATPVAKEKHYDCQTRR
jgi:hypothetical protein